MTTYLHSDEGSIAGIQDVGALTSKDGNGKRDPSKVQFVQAARRQVKRDAPDANKQWRMASTPHNPWGVELQDSIKLEPKSVYETTPIRIDGLDNGSSIFVQAGTLIAAGFTANEILGGIEWDDVAQLIADNEIDFDYMM